MSIWNVSVELANKIYTLSYIALVVGAILTAASTMSLFWTSAIRDKGADQQIQTAKENAGLANERAGIAQRDAAKANERGSELALAAEQAKTEQARLMVDLEREKVARAAFEAQFSWRHIDDAQRQILHARLSMLRHSVVVEFSSGDQEAQFLGIQLQTILKASGWRVSMRSVPSAPLMFGIFVARPENEAATIIRAALAAARMAPVAADIPIPGVFMHGDDAIANPDCRIVIGAKPTAMAVQVLSLPPH